MAIRQQGEQTEEFIDLRSRRAPRKAAQLAYHFEIFKAGEMRIEMRLLGNVTEELPVGDAIAINRLAARNSIPPSLGSISPVIILMVVDFPEPFGPR